MAKKKVKAYVKVQVAAGAATPSPPVGTALGPQGVNIMEFCKAFNAKTADLEKGMPIPVVITIYSDRTFSFITKSPPASVLIKKTLQLKSGATKPGQMKVGVLTKQQLQDIAALKAADMTGATEARKMSCIAGTARSMGIQVEGSV